MENELLDLKDLFEKVEFLDDETVKNLDFYESALYLENLNKLDDLYKELVGEDDE